LLPRSFIAKLQAQPGNIILVFNDHIRVHLGIKTFLHWMAEWVRLLTEDHKTTPMTWVHAQIPQLKC